MKSMKPELLDEMDCEKRVPALKFRCRHYRETMAHDGAVAGRENDSPDVGFRFPPPEPSCFVCGRAVNDGGWFARMYIPRRTLSLCSAPCSLMFFEAEEAPAHDHRARHRFERARDAILAAAKDATQIPNP
jgi:hypothetical protein